MPAFLSLSFLFGWLRRAARGLSVVLLLLALSSAAWAYDPPAIAGHVTDTSHQLPSGDVAQIDHKLAQYRKQSTNQIAVLVLPSLEGETIEDVAYTTFQSWKLGEKGKDNGVLLVIALADKRVRIETGKGVGGNLTDLQSNLIIRERIAPRMRQNDLRGAIDAGTDGVMEALGGATPSSRSLTARKNLPAKASKQKSPGQICLTIVLVLFLLLLISRLSRGGGFFFFFPGGGGRGWRWVGWR